MQRIVDAANTNLESVIARAKRGLGITEPLLTQEKETGDDGDGMLLPTLQKAVLFHRILEEIGLKKKLTTKRALNLCLILLK